jgi:hypothetical protein
VDVEGCVGADSVGAPAEACSSDVSFGLLPKGMIELSQPVVVLVRPPPLLVSLSSTGFVSCVSCCSGCAFATSVAESRQQSCMILSCMIDAKLSRRLVHA